MPPRPQTQLLRHPQRAHHHTSTSSHIQTPLSLNRSSLRPTACSLAQTIPYRQQRRLISSNEDGGPNAPGRHQEGKGFYRFKDLPIAGAGIAQEQSVATRNLEAMREKLPNDLGLLLGTLVMPSSHNLPMYSSQPIRRMRMEIQRLFKRVKDLISVLAFKFSQSPTIKIHWRKTAPTAAALHRQMYTALADGNLPPLAPLLTEGIQTALQSRLASRPPGTSYIWTLHRYVSAPTVVSHRAAMLPIDDGSGTKPGIRQAVVRIRSLQSLTRVDNAGMVGGGGNGGRVAVKRSPYLAHAPEPTSTPGLGRIKGSTADAPVGGKGKGQQSKMAGEAADGKEREVTEYIVIQKRIYHGKEEGWKIWGTVEETGLEEWEEALNPDVSQLAGAQGL